MKTFTSFWLLCSPVKGNFTLIWVDGKPVKVIAAYQRLHEMGDTASLALQLIKSTAVRWLLALCAGNTEICKRSPLWQLPLPTTCPRHSKRSPALAESYIPSESETVNQDAFMLFMMRYLWWQEDRLAGLLGPFQTSAPARHETHLLQTSFPLPMLTHTPKQIINKNMYQQIILDV